MSSISASRTRHPLWLAAARCCLGRLRWQQHRRRHHGAQFGGGRGSAAMPASLDVVVASAQIDETGLTQPSPGCSASS